MTEVWNTKYSKVVEWDGDPQNAPDRCETCDGTGSVYWIVLLELSLDHKRNGKAMGILSTNNLPDDEECPECHGCGSVYSE